MLLVYSVMNAMKYNSLKSIFERKYLKTQFKDRNMRRKSSKSWKTTWSRKMRHQVGVHTGSPPCAVSQITTTKQTKNKTITLLRSQFATTKDISKIRTLPYAFTREGIGMLSSVLGSDTAIVLWAFIIPQRGLWVFLLRQLLVACIRLCRHAPLQWNLHNHPHGGVKT